MQTPVQVTVVEYVAEFFRQYKSRAYGKSISVNAKGGAEALMGMLKLVLSKGGREELRIALHCFKDQLATALNSGPARNQQLEELFALLSSLIDAAERLRQFSPVKESFSTCVLEEVRWRLFRIVAGDGFSEDASVRRRALDIIFQSWQREQQEQQKSLARQQQLAAAATKGGGSSRSLGTDLKNLSPTKVRLRGHLQRTVPTSLSGPDVSSWEGLWASLGAMSGKRMMPLLQSVLTDLYMGKTIPGSPAAAAGASASAAAAGKSSVTPQKQQQQMVQRQGSNSSQCSAAAAADAGRALGRSDTAVSMDVATANAASPRFASNTAAGPGAAAAAAHAAAAYANSSSGSSTTEYCSQDSTTSNNICGVHTPPRQHSDDHDPQAAAAAAGNQQQGRSSDASSMQLPTIQQDSGTQGLLYAQPRTAAGQDSASAQQQQQYRPVRVVRPSSDSLGTDTPVASPAAAAAHAGPGDNQPSSPTASSGNLGSPTTAAKQQQKGAGGLVAKIRASVGGSSGSSSAGPAGWIPKGWVQFNREKSGAGTGSVGSPGSELEARLPATYMAGHPGVIDGADGFPEGDVNSTGTGSPAAAAAGAFAGEDVDWASCGPAAAANMRAGPATVRV